MKRCPRPWPVACRLVATILAFAANPAVAVDFGAWARHVQRHGDWVSLDFRDPTSGLFLASRAAIEDAGADATLTLTAAPGHECRLDAVIVLKQDRPAARDQERPIVLRASSDGEIQRSLPARMVAARGDRFVFFELVEEFDLQQWSTRSVLKIELPGRHHARFSLSGSERAWEAARDTCQSFLDR
jgi:tRNA threonylcarbamoyladenosine modification (KEOPS) complex Cgi121 subunit